jgi:hypothetical protein
MDSFAPGSRPSQERWRDRNQDEWRPYRSDCAHCFSRRQAGQWQEARNENLLSRQKGQRPTPDSITSAYPCSVLTEIKPATSVKFAIQISATDNNINIARISI